MTLYTATITLILVMDPLGNVPIFLSVLNPIDPKRRAKIILRETFIAFLILCSFLFVGQGILHSFSITQPALGIAGGIILFLIAIKMIFPAEHDAPPHRTREKITGEPFIVPLAVPLIAGPSAMATILLFTSQSPDKTGIYLIALMLASGVCTLTLLFSNQLRKLLGEKGLIALERLMGMLLTTLAVQMFLNGLGEYLKG
jgi:multiple antibiotic resistance protein